MARGTGQLVEFAAGARYEQLPAAVVEAAKVVILDGFANMIAGSRQPVSGYIRTYFTAQGGNPEATVAGARLPASSAAFVNGVALHCLDYEVQGYPSAHGTSSILPAVLALAERAGASGADVITAFAVGWDVQQRLRTAGEKAPPRGFHPPGVVGPMGAVAAAANLLRLPEAATAAAFGLAASRAGGLFANNGTMAKALHPGGAARAGVECAGLAACGVTANPAILEDHRGYVAAFFGEAYDEKALGTAHHLVDPGFAIKRFPAEIFMQWPMEAMRTLREEEGLDPGEVAEIVVEPPVFRADLSRPSPESGLDGKFSYEYCVAVALTQPEVRIGSFADAVLRSEVMQETLPKIRLVHNPDIPRDKAHTWARVTVHTHDGRTLARTCRRYLGAIGRPMDRETRLRKVADCLSEASRSWEPLVDVVERLETLPDLSELVQLIADE
ncbi:MmgE/PrpD family protein [Acrocarpospora macrocephala]|uniref:2-methylcitrate dehydratase n=1 Tax=Acrocarpospora macrocephala TaxID=150177 RepID=A0A5M3WUL7_9ACTN|nr:MmgE/PrpD family protein [Acrocarpospora macrocephala]GES13085.1 2-methylcitrate dehydratase [Acrocarpospora macrocephala]